MCYTEREGERKREGRREREREKEGFLWTSYSYMYMYVATKHSSRPSIIRSQDEPGNCQETVSTCVY